MGDSLELEGLSRFSGQEVEIIISPVTDASSRIQLKPNFMRFAGVAASEAFLLEELEKDATRKFSVDWRSL
ncbi:MAG: hypothetical protein HC866_17950 [Leptolyngbyaceae cyanobacterium RU_5_1]|nr:hypothetical protein [Leptolyngbyaceae cyanobacterium RU_5_1]